MTYYRVKKEYDNVYIRKGHILVRNELYTRNEIERYNVQEEYVEPVELDEKDTYWSFGARFSNDCGFYD